MVNTISVMSMAARKRNPLKSLSSQYVVYRNSYVTVSVLDCIKVLKSGTVGLYSSVSILYRNIGRQKRKSLYSNIIFIDFRKV